MRRANLLLLVLGLSLAATAQASNAVRISQVYGGAAGGTYSCDYVELFNNSNAPVDIGGWSLQYGSATGTGFGSATYNWARIPAGATIPACGYYLVRGYCSTAGAALPVTPDLVPTTGWTFNLSAAAGKVALFADQVTGRTCAQAQAVAVDLVGYGTANCYETAAAAAPDVSGVLVRASGGAVDTDDNAADFAVLPAAGVAPRNSASAPNPSCGQQPPGAPTLVGPPPGAIGVTVPAALGVTVSDPDADTLTVRFYGRPVPPPPSAPLATAATSVTFTSFQANWDATGGATSYRLDVSTDPGFGGYVTGYEDLAVVGTSRTVAGLAPGTPYHYRVRAANSGGTSGNSNTVTVTTSDAGTGAFTLVLLPDTQFYTEQSNGGTNAMFKAQTRWVVENRVSRNIAAVAHLGDVTDNDVAVEWMRADTAMRTLEDPVTTGLADGIPYVMNFGNHDDNGGGTLFDQYFGASRFSGRGYYGGHWGSSNKNSYILFSAGGLDWVMVSLQFHPDEVSGLLTWAKGIFNSYPSRKGILITHSMMYPGGDWSPGGENIYNALKDVPSLVLAACGHLNGSGRRTDVYGSNKLTTMVSNYQGDVNGGDGYLRYLEIEPALNQVRAFTYSPYRDAWKTTDWHQFVLDDVPLGGGAAGSQAAPASAPPAPAAVAAPADFALLGVVAGVPSGADAVLEWKGLDAWTPYEWHVTVDDGHHAPVPGPTWVFTTGSSATGVEGPRGAGRALGPPAPNPARGALRLAFDLPRAMHARLEVVDVQGRVVAALAEGEFAAGRHERSWDAAAAGARPGAGLYFVRLETPAGRVVRRLAVLR
jgi:hypothetical protein